MKTRYVENNVSTESKILIISKGDNLNNEDVIAEEIIASLSADQLDPLPQLTEQDIVVQVCVISDNSTAGSSVMVELEIIFKLAQYCIQAQI